MHDSFLKKVLETSTTSNCIRSDRKVGAIAVRNGEIILRASNGPSSGLETCDKRFGGCMRKKLGINQGEQLGVSWCLHAEQRIVCLAARAGISLDDAVIYCTHKPCFVCTKLLIESGISAIYYLYDYPDKNAEVYAKESGIEVIQLKVR